MLAVESYAMVRLYTIFLRLELSKIFIPIDKRLLKGVRARHDLCPDGPGQFELIKKREYPDLFFV